MSRLAELAQRTPWRWRTNYKRHVALIVLGRNDVHRNRRSAAGKTRPQSVHKHAILEQYVVRIATMTASKLTPKRSVLFDGFAG